MLRCTVQHLSRLLIAFVGLSVVVQAQSIPDEINALKKQVAELKGTVSALQTKLAAMQTPPAGEAQGHPGPAGAKGPKGEPGPPGKGVELTNMKFVNGGLETLDPTGKTTSFLGTSKEGAGGLRLSFSSKDFFSVGASDTGNGSASLFNRQAIPVVSISADAFNAGRVSTADASGVVKAVVGVEKNGLGQVAILNGKQPVVSIGQSSPASGGVAQFYDASGRQVVVVGANASQSGWLQLADGSGGKAELGIDHGRGYVKLNDKAYLSGKGSDYAEPFDLATKAGVIPGTVMSATGAGPLAPSSSRYDRKVIGVISGARDLSPGLQLGARSDGTTDLPIAMAGQVYVRVCLEAGSIQPGDLLVSSSTPGVAMRAGDLSRAFGGVIGKALEPYRGEDGHAEGLVRMLVMNR